jgi:hypothetical protein
MEHDMSSKDLRKPAPSSMPDEPAPRQKRFRIEKLEERIAPSKGGGTKRCGATTGAGSASTIY